MEGLMIYNDNNVSNNEMKSTIKNSKVKSFATTGPKITNKNTKAYTPGDTNTVVKRRALGNITNKTPTTNSFLHIGGGTKNKTNGGKLHINPPLPTSLKGSVKQAPNKIKGDGGPSHSSIRQLTFEVFEEDIHKPKEEEEEEIEVASRMRPPSPDILDSDDNDSVKLKDELSNESYLPQQILPFEEIISPKVEEKSEPFAQIISIKSMELKTEDEDMEFVFSDDDEE